MKIINTRLHGLLDYMSAFILLLPWIMEYYTGGTDTRVLAALGGITILVSICTDYEFGLIKSIPMKLHLVFDTASAIFLLTMPWLFAVNNYIFYWPVLLGAGELIVIMLSSARPYAISKRDYNIAVP